MVETSDYNPGPWRGHDFKSARKRYDAHVGRSYTDAVDSGKGLSDILEKSLSTDSHAPLVIICDVTGSMGEWPAVIFSKLPYLEIEGQEYLGKDMEISFLAVGDAYCDNYPLQARPFTKGTDLKKRLEELIIEGKGGGQTTESYELAALYCARNVSMAKAIIPICIFIGDEQPYNFVDKAHAKNIVGINLQQRLTTKEIFDELKNKFAVYLIRKPYENSGINAMSGTDMRIHRFWAELVGEDHISDLPEAGRVVDVIFGILAKETGRIGYFKNEIEGRQTPDQVKTVYKSLETIHKLPSGDSKKRAGHSVMHRKSGDGGKLKPLE